LRGVPPISWVRGPTLAGVDGSGSDWERLASRLRCPACGGGLSLRIRPAVAEACPWLKFRCGRCSARLDVEKDSLGRAAAWLAARRRAEVFP